MTLWGVNRNMPTTRDSFPRFNVTGPDEPLRGNITRIWVLVHWRIGAGIPLKSTASSPGLRWPNPIPEITTGVPEGRLGNPVVISGIGFGQRKQGDDAVLFDGIPAPSVRWTNTQMRWMFALRVA